MMMSTSSGGVAPGAAAAALRLLGVAGSVMETSG
jgi:hypothetical protein